MPSPGRAKWQVMSGGMGSGASDVHELLGQIERGERAAFGPLIEALQGPVERGTRAAFQRWNLVDGSELIDPGGIEHQTFASFLDKLKSPKYLRSLREADDPLRWAFVTAKNLTADVLKAQLPGTSDDSDSDSVPTSTAADEPSPRPDAHLERAETQQSAAGRLAALLDDQPLDDIILLEVALVEMRELPDSHVERLANRRGVSAEQVQRELAARAHVQRDRRDEYVRDREKRLGRMAAIQRDLRRVIVVCAESGDEPLDQVEPLSTERTQELRQSNAALRSATAAERAAYLDRLYEREASLAGKQQQVQAKVAGKWPAGPNYHEIIEILGLAPDDPQEAKKAINGVTVKLKRLLKRLRQQGGI